MLRARLVYILGRLAQTLLVMWVVATILFLMFRLMPGSPLVAYIDPTFTKEQAEVIKKDFGLDKPMSVQYVYYLKNLVQGDLGTSFFLKKPVFGLLMDVFPNTLLLTLTALLVAYTFGAVAGAFLAWRRGSRIETAGIVVALMTRAAPEFFVGMLALSFFSFDRGWFPASGVSKPGVIYDNIFVQVTSADFWRHLF